MPPIPANKPPPKCKAILLCDQAIVESRTNKVSIIGILSGFRVPAFPGQSKPVTLFLQLVDGLGPYEITVEIHDLRENQVIARTTGRQVEFPDRLHKANLLIPIPVFPLRHPGKYDVIVLANGQEVDRQQFTAISSAGPES